MSPRKLDLLVLQITFSTRPVIEEFEALKLLLRGSRFKLRPLEQTYSGPATEIRRLNRLLNERIWEQTEMMNILEGADISYEDFVRDITGFCGKIESMNILAPSATLAISFDDDVPEETQRTLIRELFQRIGQIEGVASIDRV